MKPRLLDVCCGAGGAAMGFHRAGFEVVGVDIRPQPNYPFEFIQRDVMTLEMWEDVPANFNAIHASPPCQFGTNLRALHADRHYVNLIPGVRRLLEATGLPYVIENVQNAREHLRHPFLLCGTSFGLNVWRHRLFETNWPIGMVPPCSHREFPDPIDVTGTGGRRLGIRPDGYGGNSRKPQSLEEAREAMGIDWMSRRELSQAIPPAYTEFIGSELREWLLGVGVAEVIA